MTRNRTCRRAAGAFVVLFAAVTTVVGTTPGEASAGTPGSGYSQAVLADTPTMYWRLDDATSSGTMSDDSGNGNDGTYSSPSPILQRQGLIAGDPDRSARFQSNAFAKWNPGSESYRGPFTVEAWVETGRTSDEHSFFSSRAIDDFSFDVKLSSGFGGEGRGIRVDVGDGRTRWFVTQTIPFDWKANTPYAIDTVASKRRVTVFVDGVHIGSVDYQATHGALPLLFDANHEVQVGMSNGYEWFDGRIDEVAVYEYALSSTQVAAHYAAGTTP